MFERALKILRLERNADTEDVRKAYIKLTRRYPPEHFPEKFKQIKHALEQLTLQPQSLDSGIKEMQSAETEMQYIQILIREFWEIAREKGHFLQDNELDVRKLKPILEANRQTRGLRQALSEIASQDLEYKT